MPVVRSIVKWIFRVALVGIVALICLWLVIRIPRAFYQRQALQPLPNFIVENAPVIALVHGRLIDGTGTAPIGDQTIVMNAGRIVAIGPSATVPVPSGARVVDVSGKTIIPGLVMMHEHLYTTSSSIMAAIHGEPRLAEQDVPFPLMYLGGGVTTMRTAGSIDGEMDLTVKHAIDTGQRPGPDMNLTAPYLEGKPSPASAPYYYPQMRQLADPADARRTVDDWVLRGMTSFKAYTNITPDELAAAIAEVHQKGLKITGHLCSVGFTEAADMGIDNLEHGILVDEEFFPKKQPGVCPDLLEALTYFSDDLDISSPAVQAMIHHLVERHVAITSTLAVFEDFAGTPQPLAAIEDREHRAMGWRTWAMYRMISGQIQKKAFLNVSKKEMQFERDFVADGGVLLAGSDPTGDGGTLAGYGDQREIELLVQAGFTPVQAIHIATQNGAEFLGQFSRIGSVAIGKQADLVVIAGDPSKQISDIRKVEVVYRNGIGYSSAKLFEAVRGLVGVN